MRKILLATDGSENAIRSAYYLADLYKKTPGVHVTVLSVSPAIPPLYREESHDPLIREQFAYWQKRREKESGEHLLRTVTALRRGGMKKTQVEGIYRQQVAGVARDIVQEARDGGYDACVVGKKGMGWFAAVFLGSITDKLLEVSEDRPLWLVDWKKWQSRKVLIAMDETRKTLDLARYAGAMLGGLKGVEILFFHFCAPATEELSTAERKKLKDLEKSVVAREREETLHHFEDARKHLVSLGLDEKAVGFEFRYHTSARPKRVSRAVLERVKKGGFGTVVIGRRGGTPSGEFRVGSAAMQIAAEASGCAVWVV